MSENCLHEFRGMDVYSKDWGGVVLHASRFEQDAYVERHRHTHAYACFLAEGTLHERVQERGFEDLSVSPAGRRIVATLVENAH